uniref:Uncharacterized protein n=1 Tax=Lotharella oceanica TaxID=641309 RepID=A0A7S2TRB9_9EUKA
MPPGMPEIPGMPKGMQNDPIKALKALQKLHELQERQADEVMSMFFLLFFVFMLLSAYRRTSAAISAAAAGQQQSRRRNAQLQADAKRKKNDSNGIINTTNGERPQRVPMYNPRANGAAAPNPSSDRTHPRASSEGDAALAKVGAVVTDAARRRVDKGLKAVGKAASAVKARAMASYRSAVKRGKKD